MRVKNACLLRYKSQLVMTPGNLFHNKSSAKIIDNPKPECIGSNQHIACISETWLDNTVMNKELTMIIITMLKQVVTEPTHFSHSVDQTCMEEVLLYMFMLTHTMLFLQLNVPFKVLFCHN